MRVEALHLVDLPHVARASEPLTDTEVAERVIEGETPLFEILMRRYNERIYRIVRSVLGREDGIEDVMQEAYVLAFVKLATYSGEGPFPAWLSRIAVREALRMRRARSRYESRDPYSASIEPSDQDMQPNPERDVELRDLLAATIDDLPPKMRAVFVLRQVEDLSERETAESLGISIASVKTSYHRARKRLRHAVEESLGAELQDVYHFGARRCDRLVEQVMRRIGRTSPGPTA